jgi:hypothetical protein
MLSLLCFISVCDCSGVQTLSDVLLFASHPDPQLRGITSTVIGCLLHAALVQSGGNFQKWFETECKWSSRTNEISVAELVKLLLKVSPAKAYEDFCVSRKVTNNHEMIKVKLSRHLNAAPCQRYTESIQLFLAPCFLWSALCIEIAPTLFIR